MTIKSYSEVEIIRHFIGFAEKATQSFVAAKGGCEAGNYKNRELFDFLEATLRTEYNRLSATSQLHMYLPIESFNAAMDYTVFGHGGVYENNLVLDDDLGLGIFSEPCDRFNERKLLRT